MALYVDWKNIQPPLTDQEKDGWAFAVGITMLANGMSKVVNDKDVAEIMARIEFSDILHGEPTLKNANGENVNTVEFWKRWQGVRVNGNDESRAAWIKRRANETFNDIVFRQMRAGQGATRGSRTQR